MREFGATLVRRWYLSLLIVLLCVGGGFGVSRVVGARYTAVATMVLIPPQSTVDAASKAANYGPPNPLLYLGGLSQSRDVLIRALSSQETLDLVKDQVPGATADVANDLLSGGPLLVITGQAKSESAALQALDIVKRRVPLVLRSLQEELGITQQNQITVLVLTSDEKVNVDRKAQIQLGVMSAAAIGLVGLLLLALSDTVPRRRARPRTPDARPAEGKDDEEAGGKDDEARGTEQLEPPPDERLPSPDENVDYSRAGVGHGSSPGSDPD